MKRRTLVIILLLVVVVSCLALTACHACEFGEWTVTIQATCTQDGSKERVCECGEKQTEVIPAGHDEVKHQAQAPTCDEIGWNDYVSCSRCDYTTYAEIAELGHTYQNKLCTVCGELQPSAGLVYDLKSGEYSVKGIGTCTDTDIIIPSTYQGVPVTKISSSAFDGCSRLTSIIIPNGVTSIGGNAFSGCTSLTSIIIPDSVTSIGSAAFSNCTSLTSITIPSSVTSIGNSAFGSCNALTGVYITDITAWCNIAFANPTANPISRAKKLYLNNEVVTALTLPNNTTAISDYAFAYCDSLTSITIPDSVKSISYRSFHFCSNLASIVVDANNENYSSIDGNLYSKNGKTLVKYAPAQTSTSFVIPSGVTTIGDYAFYRCDGLTSVTIPSSVKTIGNYAFCESSNLAKVTIYEGVISIGNSAFRSCDFTSIIIPSSVKSIGIEAFWDDNLKKVTFDDPNGWFITKTEGATSGTNLTLTDISKNAEYLSSIAYYSDYYWYKNN